jgi:zinc transporter 7
MSPSTNAILAAFASTTLISLAPNVILILFPHYASGEGFHSPILSLGQALAAGGLLGDVFLHVIPHASSSNGHHHDHDHGSHQSKHHDGEVGMWILLGFSIFLVADMMIRGLSASSSVSSHQHRHKAVHSHGGDDKTKHPPSSESSEGNNSHKTSTILLNLAADALHNVSTRGN